MINELIFLLHVFVIGSSALIALRLGKEALIAFVSVSCILANLFVVKQVTLFGLSATCADAFTVGAVFGLNLLQEYYGRAITKTAIWISFFLLIFYTIVSYIHLWYVPNEFDTTQIHYYDILHAMPRIAVASLIVYLVVQQLDSWLYGILKEHFNGKYLALRNYISIGICQFFDTLLFTFLALYGMVHSVWGIIAVSYAIKLLVIFLATPFLMLSKKIVKAEK